VTGLKSLEALIHQQEKLRRRVERVVDTGQVAVRLFLIVLQALEKRAGEGDVFADVFGDIVEPGVGNP